MIGKTLLPMALLFSASGLSCTRLLSEHPAKKPLLKYRPESVYSSDVFLALECQINDRVQALIDAQACGSEPVSTADFKSDIDDAHSIIQSLLDSMLIQAQIIIDPTRYSWAGKDNRTLTASESFLAKSACEFQRVKTASLSKISRITSPVVERNDLVSFLKLHKSLMSNFWRQIGKWLVISSASPQSQTIAEQSIIKIDYDHNSVLDCDTKLSRMQAKDRFAQFVKQELPFVTIELENSLKDDFLDFSKNYSARAMASFFATAVKLVTVLCPIQTSTVLELQVENYDKLVQILMRVLREFNKRFNRLSRFPSFENTAKQTVYKLAYWTYNILPYKDCSFQDKNDYEIMDLYWQACKNLGKPFQISIQRASWPSLN